MRSLLRFCHKWRSLINWDCPNRPVVVRAWSGNRRLGTRKRETLPLQRSNRHNRVQLSTRILVLATVGSIAIFSNQERRNLNMRNGNRDKPERKSGRAGFVDARLEELRRRLENATD